MSGGGDTRLSLLIVLEEEASHLYQAGARVRVAVLPLDHAESAIAHVHERGAQMLAGVRRFEQHVLAELAGGHGGLPAATATGAVVGRDGRDVAAADAPGPLLVEAQSPTQASSSWS